MNDVIFFSESRTDGTTALWISTGVGTGDVRIEIVKK